VAFRRRAFSGRSARPARPMDWEGAAVSISLLGPGLMAAGYILPPSIVRTRYTDPTLMATRIFLQCQNGAQTAGVWGELGFGLIAWTDVNDTAPAPGDIPSPLTNLDADWIWRYVQPIAPGAALDNNGQFLDSVHMSKAKRRLGNDKGLLMVFHNFAASNAAFYADARCLIKE